MRIVPDGFVATVIQRAFFDQVAVGQQHRITGLVGPQSDAVARHHVRSVGKVRDAAETLASHCVKKLPLETYSPINSVLVAGCMRLTICNEKGARGARTAMPDLEALVLAREERPVVDGQPDEFQIVAIEP